MVFHAYAIKTCRDFENVPGWNFIRKQKKTFSFDTMRVEGTYPSQCVFANPGGENASSASIIPCIVASCALLVESNLSPFWRVKILPPLARVKMRTLDRWHISRQKMAIEQSATSPSMSICAPKHDAIYLCWFLMKRISWHAPGQNHNQMAYSCFTEAICSWVPNYSQACFCSLFKFLSLSQPFGAVEILPGCMGSVKMETAACA